IGPDYMDKADRIGIRVGVLMEPDRFAELLKRNLEEKNRLLERVYVTDGFSFDEIYDKYLALGEEFRRYVTDTSVELNDAIDQGRHILFESAQGVVLDIDQGSYPFVTSSNPVVGGVCFGSGVGPTKLHQVIGVAMA